MTPATSLISIQLILSMEHNSTVTLNVNIIIEYESRVRKMIKARKEMIHNSVLDEPQKEMASCPVVSRFVGTQHSCGDILQA